MSGLIAAVLSFILVTPSLARIVTPLVLSAKQIRVIEEIITHDFFDPESARFRDIRAADITLDSGKVVRRVCGEVNGKNRMGGYVGFEMFGGVIEGGVFKRRDFFMPCE